MTSEVDNGQEPAIDVFYEPQHQPGSVPVEILERQELMERMPDRHMRNLQRARFHQLILCTEGSGTHHVDFLPHALTSGSVPVSYTHLTLPTIYTV